MEQIISFGGSLVSGVFGLLGTKIDTQTNSDVNSYQKGQSDLATQRTRDAVAAAVAAAVAIALAVFVVKATGK